MHDDKEILGPCPLCGRDMIEGVSVNKHHLMPKSLGGRDMYWIHVVCHSKIHSVFTLRELQHHYHTFERLREHEEIQKFVKWVRKKAPDFKTKHRQASRKRR